MEVYEMLSEKERPMLVIFDFKFRLHKTLANNVEKWCCTNKKCKSYIKRCNNEILRSQSKFDINDHNHQARVEPTTNRRKLRISIKKNATDIICKEPPKLILNALKKSGVGNNTRTDVNYTQKGIHGARRKILPAKPTCKQELPEILRSLDLKINDGPIAFSSTGSGVVHSTGLVAYKNNLVNLAVTWDREIGVFTCACSGLYQFSFSGATEGNTRMVLQKKLNNNKQWSPILATEPGGGSATILLEIENGDQVAIYLKGNPKKFKTYEQGIEVTSFSGYRIAKT